MTRNTQISLAKKYTMAPGHQLHHLYIRAHSTQPQHQYLRVLTEYFCLWRVTYSDESAQAILYHFPGPQASLHLPHPPFYWHVISWRSSGAAADRHTIYDRAKQLDRSSGISPPENQDRPPARQSALYDSPVDKHPRHAEETSATKSNRRSRRPHDGRTKKQRENVDLHIT